MDAHHSTGAGSKGYGKIERLGAAASSGEASFAGYGKGSGKTDAQKICQVLARMEDKQQQMQALQQQQRQLDQIALAVEVIRRLLNGEPLPPPPGETAAPCLAHISSGEYMW